MLSAMLLPFSLFILVGSKPNIPKIIRYNPRRIQMSTTRILMKRAPATTENLRRFLVTPGLAAIISLTGCMTTTTAVKKEPIY
jgi:hypothetical protein